MAAAAVGPVKHCSRRHAHNAVYFKRREINVRVDDVAGNICQALGGGGINPDPGARSGIHGLGYRRRGER
jgi:hypothetical protein